MLTRDLKNEYQGNTKNRTPSHVIKTNEFSQPVQLDDHSSFSNYSFCFRKISKLRPYVNQIQFRHQQWIYEIFIRTEFLIISDTKYIVIRNMYSKNHLK